MFEPDTKSVYRKHRHSAQSRSTITDAKGFVTALGEDHRITDTLLT